LRAREREKERERERKQIVISRDLITPTPSDRVTEAAAIEDKKADSKKSIKEGVMEVKSSDDGIYATESNI
jgi:hypothetical protein